MQKTRSLLAACVAVAISCGAFVAPASAKPMRHHPHMMMHKKPMMKMHHRKKMMMMRRHHTMRHNM